MTSKRLSAAAPLVAVVALAAAVRLVGIGDESYWYDEIWSLDQVRKPFGAMLAALIREDVHPPLYSVLLWGWTRLVGEGEAASRLLSALFGTAAVVPLYLVGRDLWDRRTGLLAAALLAVNPYSVFYGRETRSYALMLFLATLSMAALVRWALAPAHRGRAVAWFAASTLLAYTHVYGSFVLLAEGLWVLGFVPAMRRHILLGGAAVGLALAPWAPFLLGQAGRVQQGFWIEPLRWTDPLDWLRRWYGYSIPLAVLLPLVSLRAAVEPGDGAPPRGARRALLALWVALPVGVPVVLSLIGSPIFYHKYPIAILGALSLLTARGLLLLPQRPRLVAGVVVAGLLAWKLPTEVHLSRSKEQWRELSAIATTAAGEGSVLVAEGYNRTYLGWYLRVPVMWLDEAGAVERAEARARGAGAGILYLQAHPTHGEHEGDFDARWQRGGTEELIGARATRYTPR